MTSDIHTKAVSHEGDAIKARGDISQGQEHMFTSVTEDQSL